MEKRHRRVLSKQVISDSLSGWKEFIQFVFFVCELKRAEGRALSLSSRPSAVANPGLFLGGGGDHCGLGRKICFNCFSSSDFKTNGSKLA
jgi:hypothetical protein